MLKLKVVLAAAISILPINALRVLGYRLLGYRVRDARIGFGTVIAVTSASLAGCRLGWFNLLIGPMAVRIEPGAAIEHRNTFACGFWTSRKQYGSARYARRLFIGADAVITSTHYFDVAGEFRLGARSWIGGIGSQFWTHGAGVHERDIRIGEDCYLGSAVRFAPGAGIPDRVIVAMGSVVTKQFTETRALIGGVPAVVLKSDHDWKEMDAAPAAVA